MNIFKHYGFTICLVAGIIIGGVCGVVFGPAAKAVKPIGDIFLNLMFIMIVPLVFLSVSLAMYNMRKMNMIGKVLATVVAVFVGCNVVYALMAYGLTLVYNPLEGIDKAQILANLPSRIEDRGMSFGEILVNTLTVPDFLQLFTKNNLLPLILFSVLFGLATASSKVHGQVVVDLLEAGMAITLRMMRIIMLAAPIGLGCYFADTIGTVGSQILSGYLHAFLLYLLITVIAFFGLNTLYIWVAGGRRTVGLFWRHILEPSLLAVATSSSAACMPINMEAAEKMGVRKDISDTVVPLGTNMFKCGSVMSGILKVVFLLTIFGQNTTSWESGLYIIGVALISAAVVGAIPSGGMTGELLICSIFGFSPQLAGTLMVLSTIVDIPATLLNSTGNVVAAVLVDKFSMPSKASAVD